MNAKFSLATQVQSAIIIGIFALICTMVLTSGGISFRNTSPVATVDGKILNTITTSGIGKVTATPDMLTFSITISETASTSSAALTAINSKVTAVIDTLKRNSIAEDNIKTSSFSISPEYDYGTNRVTLVGQKASQTLSVTVKELGEKNAKATKLIDEVSQISNVQITGLNFDISDKTTYIAQARVIAYTQAETVARELATLSRSGLGSPVTISESANDTIAYPPYAGGSADISKSISVTQIPSGTMEIEVNLNIQWGIK